MTDLQETYFRFVEERHRIWEKRQAGEPQPWTDDLVLSRLKFTNMFRVLDPGSQFVLTDLYDETSERDFLMRCFLYRITNLPETWHEMRDKLGRYPTHADMDHLVDILQARRKAKKQVFSGAYIIIPEPNTKNDKIEGVVKITRWFIRRIPDFIGAKTQEERFKILTSIPGIGRFLAMQILTDWGYGQEINRENEFIVGGPGAVRGAMHFDPLNKTGDVIRYLRNVWSRHDEAHPRLGDYPLSLMDVQNTLCEFSKYVRETERPRKVSSYQPAHPGPQPRPVLPVWMY